MRSVVLLVKDRNRTALSSTSEAAEPVTQSEATERIMNCQLCNRAALAEQSGARIVNCELSIVN